MRRRHGIVLGMLFLFALSLTLTLALSVDVHAGLDRCCWLEAMPGCTPEGGIRDPLHSDECIPVAHNDSCYIAPICN
jgi:hypothetical protein